MTEQPKLLPVTQEDRDAAADWLATDDDAPDMQHFAAHIRNGGEDSHSLVQAFAAHRTRRDERVDALVSALTEAREIVDAVTDLSRDCIGKLPKAREALARNKALLAQIDAALQLIGKE